MKLTKKILALVLAVVMVCGLLQTVGAAGYSDARSIKHRGAVEVLTALGVIAGYPNGTFRPATTVTRAEMAKILAFLLNQGVDAGEQFADGCTFADCQSHWAKGYIGYCVAKGLINGKSPTVFDPEGKVTLAEEAKMLLCALGYDTAIRGYTGSEWKISVARDAAGAGLLTDISELKNDDQMSRDDACQLILNALKADMVKFPNASSVLIDGDPEVGQIIYSKDLKIEYVTAAEKSIYFDYNNRDLNTTVGGQRAQFCETLYSELRLVPDGATETGAPAEAWTYKGHALGSYQTMQPTFTSDAGVYGKTLRSKLPSLPLKVTLYSDGVRQSYYDIDMLKAAIPAWANKDEKGIISAATSANNTNTTGADGRGFYYQLSGNGAAGVMIQSWRNTGDSTLFAYGNSGSASIAFATNGFHSAYYYDETERHLTVTSQANYPAEVRGVVPAVTDADGNVTRSGYVTLLLLNGGPTGYTGGELALSEDFTVHTSSASTALMDPSLLGEEASLTAGDRVVVQFAHDSLKEPDGEFHITSALLMETASGAADQVYASSGSTLSSFKIGKTTYTRANKCNVSSINDVVAGKNYKVSYATFGSSNLAFMVESLASDYVYLMSAGPYNDPLSKHKAAAKIMKPDGSTETIFTVEDYWASVGHLVTFTQNKKTEEYTLTAVGAYSGSQPGDGGTVKIDNNKAMLTLGNNTLTADSNTTFIVITRDVNNEQVVNVYKGIEKVPSINAANYYAYAIENDRVVTAVLEDATVTGISGVYGIMVKTDNDSLKTDDLGSYYVVNAIVGGQVETLKVSQSVYNNSLNLGLNIYKNLNRDENGLVTSFTAIHGTEIVSMTQPDKGIVTFNGTTALSYHNSVLIYVYHAKTRTLEIVQSATELSPIDPVEQPFEYNQYASYYTLNPEYDYPVLAGMYLSID